MQDEEGFPLTQYTFPPHPLPEVFEGPVNSGQLQSPFVIPLTEDDTGTFTNVSDGNPLPVDIPTAMDTFTGAVGVINEPHLMVHRGNVFHVSGKITALANGASHDFLVAVPAATFPHFNAVRMHYGGGNVDLLVYENPTVTVPGSVLSSFNVNRNSSNTPDTVITSAPTTSAVGTLLATHWAPPTAAGVGLSADGVSITQGEEWVLAQNEDYLVRITNNSGASIDFAYEFVWYEVIS